MASRRQGIQLFSSLFRTVRSELAAGGTGSSGAAARETWPHLPAPSQAQQLVNLRDVLPGGQAAFATSARQAKEAISDIAKSASKRRPRAAKDANTDVAKERKPRSKRVASEDPEALDQPKRTPRRQLASDDAVPSTAKPRVTRSGRPRSNKDATTSASTTGSASESLPKLRPGRRSKSDRAQSSTAEASGVSLATSESAKPLTRTPRASRASTKDNSSGSKALAAASDPTAGATRKARAGRKPADDATRSTSRAAAVAKDADSSSTGQAAAADVKPEGTRRSRRRVRQTTQDEATTDSLSLPSYSQLRSSASGQQRLALSDKQEAAVKDHMATFRGSANVQDQALSLYVNAKLFNTAVNELEDFLLRSVTPQLAGAFVANSPDRAAEDALFNLFAEYVVYNYSQELQAYRTRVQSVDMRKSHLWYPVARALDRKIIYHAGPTNSGKTYNALQAMKAASSGLYCGPLRLLAMEVYDSVNQQGTLCNLYTGQERQELEGARHASCTIEMINTTKHWECAVLDEIQMIGDDQRGWAWTRALQGLPANEIHLCGDASALPLVKQMCDNMGETLTVCNYDRFTQLEIEPRSLPEAYASVQAGDAVVAFSRRDIYDIKASIERRTKHRCCVIYGALPPEMRRHQATLFNDPKSGFDVLVASDAVGMGLNLNIRRILFHKVEKFEGRECVPVSPSAIKQIAGRAGRRNSIYPKGLVGTHKQADLPRVIEAVNMPLAQLSTPAAGLFPEFQHLELLAGQVPNDSFGTLLERFSNEAKLEGTFFFCRQDSVMQVARLLEKVDNLSLEDRFDFCMAPAQIRDNRQAAVLLHFAARYANGMPVTLDINVPKVVPASAEELRHMEATHQVMSLWVWLSHRFGSHAFPGLEHVMEQSAGMIKLMNQGLELMSDMNRKGGRRKATVGLTVRGLPKSNLQAALLQKQDPLALAYLADAQNHQAIFNTEWLTPSEKQAQAVAQLNAA